MLPPLSGQAPQPWEGRRYNKLDEKNGTFRNHKTGAREFGKSKPNDWIKDKRFHKLTKLLGERYSPHKLDEAAKPAKTHGAVISNII